MQETSSSRLTGAVFAVVGALFFAGSVQLDLGNWQDLGPGMWPLICSLLLFLVGLVLVLRR